MISFELTQEQALAQSMVRQMAASVLRPAARDADERQAIPSSILNQIWSAEIVQSQAALDGAAQPSAALNAILLEELAAADASFAIAAGAPIGFVSAIASQGSASQRQSLLPAFAGAEYRCAAVAVAEPDFAFDVSSIGATTKLRSP